MTHLVAHILEDAGYEVGVQAWGCHNTIITTITKDGVSIIPASVSVGYGDPRAYLPGKLVRLLDTQLPDPAEALS